MANLSFQVSPNDLYSTGYIVQLPDGRQLLKREKYTSNSTTDKDITHTIKDNENIWDIASRYYQDDLYWKVIADVNNIENPFELTPGQEIIIPDIDKAKLQII
jgi:nucleoid-associated protein YgaU